MHITNAIVFNDLIKSSLTVGTLVFGLKIRRPYGHRGSIPLPSTNAITKYQSGIYGPKKDERLFFTVFRSKASQSKPKAAFPFMNPEKLDIRPSKKTTLIRMRLALPV